MFDKLTKALWVHIEYNKMLYLIIVSSIIIGICIGAGSCTVMSEQQAQEMRSYLIESAKGLNTIDLSQTFKIAFLNTLKLSILIWICGFSVIGIGITPIIIGIRCYSCGYTVALLIRLCGGAGILAGIVGVLPQMVIMLPVLAAFCVISMRFSKNITLSKLEKTEKSKMLLSYTIFSGFMMLMLFLCALIEGYVSPSLFSSTLSIIR